MIEVKRVIAVILSCFLICALSACSSVKPLEKGQAAPFTRITLLESGEYVALEEFQGRSGSVLLFWASWCSKSRGLIEELDQLAGKLKAAGSDISFVAISLDKLADEEKLRKFLNENETANLLHAFSGNYSNDEAMFAYHISQVPTLVLVSTDRKILYFGASVDELEEVLLSVGSL